MTEAKIIDFGPIASKKVECYYCSKAFVNHQGLSVHGLCTALCAGTERRSNQ